MENEMINRLGKVIFQVNDRDDGFVWTSVEGFEKCYPGISLKGLDLKTGTFTLQQENRRLKLGPSCSVINDNHGDPIASLIELELHDGIRIEDISDEDEVCWIEFFSCPVRDGKLVVKRRSCLSGYGGDMDHASDDYCVIPIPFVNPDPEPDAGYLLR